MIKKCKMPSRFSDTLWKCKTSLKSNDLSKCYFVISLIIHMHYTDPLHIILYISFLQISMSKNVFLIHHYYSRFKGILRYLNPDFGHIDHFFKSSIIVRYILKGLKSLSGSHNLRKFQWAGWIFLNHGKIITPII